MDVLHKEEQNDFFMLFIISSCFFVEVKIIKQKLLKLKAFFIATLSWIYIYKIFEMKLSHLYRIIRRSGGEEELFSISMFSVSESFEFNFNVEWGAVLGNYEREDCLCELQFVEVFLRGAVETFTGNELGLEINLQMTKVEAHFELFCRKFYRFRKK